MEVTSNSRVISFVVQIFLCSLISLFSISSASNIEPCEGTEESCQKRSSDLSFWYSFAIGYVSSAIVIIVAFMYYCVPWAQLKKKKKKKRQNHGVYTNRSRNPLPLVLLDQENQMIGKVLEKLSSTMNFIKLCKATNYFSMNNLIGLGRTGMMYKAKHPNGSFLAVKRQYDSKLFDRVFALELIIHQRFRHRNLIPLLGFCTERNERLLVYEYMLNGRLSDWLRHPLHNEAMKILEWPIRLKIALGLARGLSGFHHSCNLQIVHLSIDSECVLLDENFEPKISNFGSVKFLDGNCKKHMAKKDVYDLGIVLFELIAGKELTADSLESNGNVIDDCLLGKGFDAEISFLIGVARDCIHKSPLRRPSMLDVYKRITTLWEGYGAGD